MDQTFIETREFTAFREQYLADVEFAALQNQLRARPEAGDVMPGCGGLRKIRVSAPRRNQGKRGGSRVIYLCVPETGRFYLLDIYGKDEQDDLSAAQRKVLSRLAARLRSEALTSHARWLQENQDGT